MTVHNIAGRSRAVKGGEEMAAERRLPAPDHAPRGRKGSLLRRIVRHEWRSLAADGTLRVVLVLVTILVGYALFNGAAWSAFQERTVEAVRADDDTRVTELSERVRAIADGAEEAPSPFRDPRRPAAVGGNLGRQHALLPPGPLSLLAVGRSDLLPHYVPVTTASREAALSGVEIENPVHLLTGRFDLAFVVVFILPLLVLGLGYNLLSQEREDGTLALVLSQPISLAKLLLGKVLARFALVMGALVGVTLAGLLLLGVNPAAEGVATGLLLWVAVVTLYAAFWFAVAAAVNARGAGSAINAIVLSAAWLLLTIVLPGVINAAATMLHPVPSRVEMIGATREASRQASAEGSALLAQFYEDHPELMPDGEASLNDFAAISLTVEEAVEARTSPVREHFATQLQRQQELVERFRFLSPAILVQGAMNDIAGTGDARHRHFLTQLDAFHGEWRGYFVPRVYRQSLLTPEEMRSQPRWSYREEPTARMAGRVGAALAGMLLLLLVVTAFGGRALGRYPRSG